MKRGFSLVELSIVIVILGLLTGGILAGQSLIKSAELRSVTTDYEKYKGATIAFRQKYEALPGDYSNAIATWGAAHATPATCVTTASTTALTCDGNDDGIIFPSAGSNESFRYWQHLKNAGYIEGTFDGIQHGANSYAATTANVPSGKINNSLWFAWNWGTYSGLSYMFDGAYNNILEFGRAVADNDPANPIFKPEELWNIDMKIDDGKPATGYLVARAQGGLATCTSTASSSVPTADYLLSSSTIACNAIFRNQFIRN